jgi:hypothetical protein
MSTRPNLPAYYPVEIDLGTYIVERWKQLGVGHVFGVPGDFNLGVSHEYRKRVYVQRGSWLNLGWCGVERGGSSWIISKKIPRFIGWGLVRRILKPLHIVSLDRLANRMRL